MSLIGNIIWLIFGGLVNYPTPTAKAVRSGLSVALGLLCSTREQDKPGPLGWFTAAPIDRYQCLK